MRAAAIGPPWRPGAVAFVACALGAHLPRACSAEQPHGSLLDAQQCAQWGAASCDRHASGQDAWSEDSDAEANLMTTSLLQLTHVQGRVPGSAVKTGANDTPAAKASGASLLQLSHVHGQIPVPAVKTDANDTPATKAAAIPLRHENLVEQGTQKEQQRPKAGAAKAATAAMGSVDGDQQSRARLGAAQGGVVQEGKITAVPFSQSAFIPTPYGGKVLLGAMFVVMIVLSSCREDNDGLDLFPAARVKKIKEALTHEHQSSAVDQETLTPQLPSVCRGVGRASRLAMATAAFKRASEWSSSIAGPDRSQKLGAACRVGPDGRRGLELYVIGADGEPLTIASAVMCEQDSGALSLKVLDKDKMLLGTLEAERGDEGFVFMSPAGVALARLGPNPEGDHLELTSSADGQRLASATPRMAMELQANAPSPPALLTEDHLDIIAEHGTDAAFVLLCALAVTIFEMRSDA